MILNLVTPESPSLIGVRWSKEGETRLPFGVKDDGDGKLLFADVAMTSSGVYKCSVGADDAEASASANVVVTERRGSFGSIWMN